MQNQVWPVTLLRCSVQVQVGGGVDFSFPLLTLPLLPGVGASVDEAEVNPPCPAGAG
jgi:hypothetical protein